MVELLQGDDELWNRFLLRGLRPDMARNESVRELFHFYAPDKLYALGRKLSPREVEWPGLLPVIDWRRVLDYQDNSLHPSTRKSIKNSQDALKLWGEAWERGERFRPLPTPPDSPKASVFAEQWRAAFAPLHEWLQAAALAFGREVANDYEKFRLTEGVMTYDDQVRMALDVLKHPAVQKELAAEQLSVLLDEAQDTDPRQFEVLLRVAGLPDATVQGEDQTFCMVGDFQQAIYAPRSDLPFYQKVHDDLLDHSRGTLSELTVTFRCDRAIIDFVNGMFSSVLDNAAGQSKFVRLLPRDDAGPGRVIRWTCPDNLEPIDGKITADMREEHEARFLAQRLLELGPAGVGASDWSQVAILCPRKNWLLAIQHELHSLDLPVQLHSSNEQQGNRTATSWLTALIWIAAFPEDSFEVAGVLREIFGISDHDMAMFTAGDGDRLRLDQPIAISAHAGLLEHTLLLLLETFRNTAKLPLLQAVHRIVESTRLRERLDSIPDIREQDAGRELNELLAVIAGRSAKGITLAELATELRHGLTQTSPAEEEIRDAIQLMTSFKAKGLEWQTVIVPFIFRKIESKSEPFPRVVQREDGLEAVFRDKADFAGISDFVERRDRQQLQRLLYVTSTRARHTLVFIDDESLYATKTRTVGYSSAELFALDSPKQRAIWDSVPETPVTLDIAHPTAVPVGPGLVQVLPEISGPDISEAVAKAKMIPYRTSPHALAMHPPRDAEPEARQEIEDETPSADNPGILYGTWWHELMEVIPWSQPREIWQRKFTEALEFSPQKERSVREWHLFCQSELASWLADPAKVVQVEWPFLWRSPDGNCVEGVMDLAVFSPADSTWDVIDWKTNRVDAQTDLVAVYRGQIRAYMDVLSKMLSCEVRGSLYLTQTGQKLSIS
jgi:ATP-dependent exoDNAse (exonuclease V) beta subunit